MAGKYVIYGKRPDGTLDICRARPEYRGKGTCKHSEHAEVDTRDKALHEAITSHNEKIFATQYNTLVAAKADNDPIPEGITADSVKTHEGGATLTKEELQESSQHISTQFRQEDWKFIKDFYKAYHKRLSSHALTQRYEDASENIHDYLRSDDPTAEKIRSYLGEEVDLREFSRIITYNVGSMTAADTWRPGRTASIPRVVLSSVDNDMTKERYISSIMFFGGRCCYCNRVLSKNPPPSQQASGEHITPISPEDKNDIHGGTRYGNMVLACVKCNNNRKNQNLEKWVAETRCISEENKGRALERIEAFREYALYSEYSEEDNEKIRESIDDIQKYVDSCKNPDGSYKKGATERIKKRIKIELYDLRQNL